MTSPTPSYNWKTAFSDLRTWKKGTTRAVHKPLLTLMLLGRASRGEAREVSYSEVAEPLAALLKEFGPTRATYHSEFPFWHLKSDGFWVVKDAGQFPLKTGGSSPTKRSLLAGNAVGYMKEDLWSDLVGNPQLRNELADQLLCDFWPDTLHAAIKQAVGLPDYAPGEPTQKKRDPQFRVKVMRAYRSECAVCGYDGRLAGVPLGVQAAHVKWHAYDGPDSVANGVALCSFHHLALDTGAMGLDEGRRVIVSCDVAGGTRVEEQLYRYEGQPIRDPQPGMPELDSRFIAWHQAQVFKKPARMIAP